MSEPLAQLAARLRDAAHVGILTGAGVSAESGVPTFRDAQTGLWAEYHAEDLATPEAFARDPLLVWRWYAWRRELVAAAQPNAGHVALAGLQRILPRLSLITQNVDGLHQRAGSEGVIEFHGNIQRTVCSVERCEVSVPDDTPSDEVPCCPGCGALLRPDVVWFGEAIPVEALQAAGTAASACELFIAIGTSAQVHPAAGLADLAAQNGAMLAEINPEATPLSGRTDYVLRGTSAQLLPALLQAVSAIKK